MDCDADMGHLPPYKKDIPVPIPQNLDKLFMRLEKYIREYGKKSEAVIRKKRLAEEHKAQEERIVQIVAPNPDKNSIVSVMRYCRAGDLESVQTVWERAKEQFDVTTKDGLTVWNFAAKDMRILKFLVKIKKTAFTVFPIASACEVKSDVDKRLSLLKKLGADINEKNENGEPPLVVAAESFNVRAIRWLVRHGADISATNANGETATDIILKNKDVFKWRGTLQFLQQKNQPENMIRQFLTQ